MTRRRLMWTLFAALMVVPLSAAQDETAAVTAWLRSYDAAFNAKDLEKLASFYHPDVTIFEGSRLHGS